MAATQLQRMHEGLTGFLGPSAGPPTFSVPSAPLNARLPVRPGESVPSGLRPIPTSSQGPKKTNAQIPYPRLCAARVDAHTGLHVPPMEGDIVLVERAATLRPSRNSATDAFAYAWTIERLNTELETPREAPDADSPAAHTYDTFPYRVDGVINSIDGADVSHEFRDQTLAVVAIHGPVRLDHSEGRRCCFRKTLAGTIVYVGLETKPAPPAATGRARAVHRLVRFSSAQITSGAYDFGASEGYTLVCAWALGMLLDSNQVRSSGVLTDGAMARSLVSVSVNVTPLRAIDPNDAQSYQVYTDAAGDEQRVWEVLADEPAWSRRGRVEKPLKKRSVRTQLRRRWVPEEADTSDEEA